MPRQAYLWRSQVVLPPPEAIQVLMQLEVHIESSLVAVVQIELMFRYLSDP